MRCSGDLLATDDWKAVHTEAVKGHWHIPEWVQVSCNGPGSLGLADNVLTFK